MVEIEMQISWVSFDYFTNCGKKIIFGSMPTGFWQQPVQF